jgi:hypothetical protein
MSLLRLLDTPVSWALGGLAVGVGLGVDDLSVWLLAAGLGGFVAYLLLHGQAEAKTEGRLFAAGPALIMGWLAGFVIHGLVF